MDYLSEIKKNKQILKLEQDVRAKGDMKTLNNLALEAGHIASDVLRANLEEVGIDQNSTIEDIRSVVSPVLRANHKYVSELAAVSINKMYKSNKIGLKAFSPEYNQDREDEIVHMISDKRFADGSD